MTIRRTLSIGRQRFRVRPWHADPQVAQVAFLPRETRPTVEELHQMVAEIAALGYRSVLTSALDTSEVPTFLAAGFAEEDRLRVLAHDLRGLDRAVANTPSAILRRGRRPDRADCLALDAHAFPPFWRMDEDGLADARSATPASRFRVAVLGGHVVGYAVTGRSGQQGFLQRLATDPSHRRQGVGASLVRDGLLWCARRRCRAVYVNTQVSNEAALALYERLGFRRTPDDMVVLRWEGPL